MSEPRLQRRLLALVGGTCLFGCSARASMDEPSANPTSHEAERANPSRSVTWGELREEMEATICTRRFELEGQEPIDEPWWGEREVCGLPPASTPLQRAVAEGTRQARSVTWRLPIEGELLATMKLDDDARLAGLRRAYLRDEFAAPWLRRIHVALQAEGLACSDCPVPHVPRKQTLSLRAFLPYFNAYVWPEPVVTPRDDEGRATGKPKVGLRICAGINGAKEMSSPDPELLHAGFLAAFHSGLVLERAPKVIKAVLREPAFAELERDEDRTAYLRTELARRLGADPEIRAAICETVARFETDTGVVLTDCE